MDFMVEKASWPLVLLGAAALIIVFAVRIPACISFEQDIKGHLKRAADANTLELAKQELGAALKGIHDWKLCTKGDPRFHGEDRGHDCYTNIFYRTPEDDVLFWRQNLEAAMVDLKSVPKEADHLTVSNRLMKLRETILDSGGDSPSVTYPPGTHVYPSNVWLFWVALLGTISFCFGWFFLLIRYDW